MTIAPLATPIIADRPDMSAPRRHRLHYAAALMVCAIGGSALLMPEAGWSRLSALFHAPASTPSDEAPVAISEVEKEELISLTQSGLPQPIIKGEDAIKVNEALPFAAQPIRAARAFQLASIATPNAMTALKCMTQAIYYEAGFEPEAGRRAVAQVVLNRMRHPAFPKSVCGVVYEGANQPVCQFSFTCDGSLAHAPQPAAWRAAERIARDALQGRVEATVGLATHYHANYVSPYWAPHLTKLAQIATHIFYRWPGGWGTPAAFNGRYAGMEAIPALLPRDALPVLATADDQTEALARATLPANLVPIRHAANDVGGRLDISKGWKLNIPSPTDASRTTTALASRQQAVRVVAATANAATTNEGNGL